MEELKATLLADLTAELTITDDDFNEQLLEVKINGAIREVKEARHYPSHYTEEMIASDIESFYGNIRDLALYDYNTVGVEFQKSMNENSVSRTWADRSTMFNGVVPIAH